MSDSKQQLINNFSMAAAPIRQPVYGQGEDAVTLIQEEAQRQFKVIFERLLEQHYGLEFTPDTRINFGTTDPDKGMVYTMLIPFSRGESSEDIERLCDGMENLVSDISKRAEGKNIMVKPYGASNIITLFYSPGDMYDIMLDIVKKHIPESRAAIQSLNYIAHILDYMDVRLSAPEQRLN